MRTPTPSTRSGMQRYANRSRMSGVTAYRIGESWIDVEFINGDIYRYDIAGVGKRHLEKMYAFARRGQGLAAYISRHVREDYSSKYSSRTATEWNESAAKRH